MKKKYWPLACAVVIMLASILYGGVAAAAQPGDASDPLVSKSYVDTQINQLKTLIASVTGALSNTSGNVNAAPATSLTQEEREAIIAETLAYVEAIYGDALKQSAATGGSTSDVNNSRGANAEFVVVRMDKGQTLIGYASTEIILRGGSAVAVTGVNGLCDITGGVDITNGMGIKLNHLLIVPSGDGRGLTCTTESYLMVKGGYYIVD